jgi:hypothetical protein
MTFKKSAIKIYKTTVAGKNIEKKWSSGGYKSDNDVLILLAFITMGPSSNFNDLIPGDVFVSLNKRTAVIKKP